MSRLPILLISAFTINFINVLDAAPQWWGAYSVLGPGPADDYAVANIGQLKYFASKAAGAMDAELAAVGGAGPGITQMVTAFTAGNDNYLVVNLGQLKNVAAAFYDRIGELGYAPSAAYAGTWYPWAATAAEADDFALANLGQLKYVFSFDLEPVSQAARPLTLRRAKLLLTAESGVTVGSDGRVLSWADQSGSGLKATPASVANRPRLQKRDLFEKSAVIFDGADDFLTVAGLNGSMGEYTVVWVTKPTIVGASNQAISTTASAGFTFSVSSAGAVTVGTNLASAITPGAGAGQSSAGIFVADRWILCGFTYSSGVGTFYKNGVAVTRKSGMVAPSAFGTLRLGVGSTSSLCGSLAEFILYDTALSPNEMNSLFQYLSSKYGFELDQDFDGRYDGQSGAGAQAISISITAPAHNPTL